MSRNVVVGVCLFLLAVLSKVISLVLDFLISVVSGSTAVGAFYEKHSNWINILFFLMVLLWILLSSLTITFTDSPDRWSVHVVRFSRALLYISTGGFIGFVISITAGVPPLFVLCVVGIGCFAGYAMLPFF